MRLTKLKYSCLIAKVEEHVSEMLRMLRTWSRKIFPYLRNVNEYGHIHISLGSASTLDDVQRKPRQARLFVA